MRVLLSETEQVAALARGQMPAFEALYHRYKQPVFANIQKMVYDKVRATASPAPFSGESRGRYSDTCR